MNTSIYTGFSANILFLFFISVSFTYLLFLKNFLLYAICLVCILIISFEIEYTRTNYSYYEIGSNGGLSFHNFINICIWYCSLRYITFRYIFYFFYAIYLLFFYNSSLFFFLEKIWFFYIELTICTLNLFDFEYNRAREQYNVLSNYFTKYNNYALFF